MGFWSCLPESSRGKTSRREGRNPKRRKGEREKGKEKRYKYSPGWYHQNGDEA